MHLIQIIYIIDLKANKWIFHEQQMQDKGEIYLSFIEKRGWGGGGLVNSCRLKHPLKKKKLILINLKRRNGKKGGRSA